MKTRAELFEEVVENGLFDINSSYYIEVIGNIYDNPELLRGHEK